MPPPTLFPGFFIIFRAFSDPISRQTLATLLHLILSTRDLSIYLSFMSHGTNRRLNRREASAKHLLVLIFLAHRNIYRGWFRSIQKVYVAMGRHSWDGKDTPFVDQPLTSVRLHTRGFKYMIPFMPLITLWGKCSHCILQSWKLRLWVLKGCCQGHMHPLYHGVGTTAIVTSYPFPSTWITNTTIRKVILSESFLQWQTRTQEA